MAIIEYANHFAAGICMAHWLHVHCANLYTQTRRN